MLRVQGKCLKHELSHTPNRNINQRQTTTQQRGSRQNRATTTKRIQTFFKVALCTVISHEQLVANARQRSCNRSVGKVSRQAMSCFWKHDALLSIARDMSIQTQMVAIFSNWEQLGFNSVTFENDQPTVGGAHTQTRTHTASRQVPSLPFRARPGAGRRPCSASCRRRQESPGIPAHHDWWLLDGSIETSMDSPKGRKLHSNSCPKRR